MAPLTADQLIAILLVKVPSVAETVAGFWLGQVVGVGIGVLVAPGDKVGVKMEGTVGVAGGKVGRRVGAAVGTAQVLVPGL